MMDRQKIFTNGYLGIIAQGGPSLGPNNRCSYRGRNNSKCALGHNISDEDYDPSMEGKGPALIKDTPSADIAKAIGAESHSDVAFAKDFQALHDSMATSRENFIESFKLNAKSFAERHNLCIP